MLSKRSQLNRLFDDVMNWNDQLWTSFGYALDHIEPINSIVETIESDGKIKYAIDVPGVTKDQISLVHEGKYIKVEAKRTDKAVESSFKTTFSISPKAKVETLEASLQNGVLYISFDAKQNSEKSEAKQIEIKEIPKLGP